MQAWLATCILARDPAVRVPVGYWFTRNAKGPSHTEIELQRPAEGVGPMGQPMFEDPS